MTGEAAFDVVVLGEVLLEVGTEQPFGHGVPAQLQVSGRRAQRRRLRRGGRRAGRAWPAC